MNTTSTNNYTVKVRKKQYYHLTKEDRFRLEKLLDEQLKENGRYNISEIARLLGRSRSTIYREMKRNKTMLLTSYRANDCIFKDKKKITFEYDYEEADKKAKSRQIERGKRRKKLLDDPELRKEVNRLMVEEEKPPDVVAYLIRRNSRIKTKISTNTIYDGIRKGFLEVKLADRKRMKTKNRRVKKGVKRVPPSESKRTRSIELRPEHINNREEFGHFEMDTVLGKRGENKECLLTLVERKTRYGVIIKLRNKTKAEVNEKIELIKEYLGERSSEIIKSITTDNGSEFADFEKIENILGTTIYFCHAGSSFEKGTNERYNGMVREYIPKKTAIEDYDVQYINKVALKINDLERRNLDYTTPYQKVLMYGEDVESTELLFTLQEVVNSQY